MTDFILKHARVILALFALATALPGIVALPPLDRDEGRYAQATTQMLETGDIVEIRFHDGPRNKKPAGIHWLQAAFTAALSDPETREIWTYRLPSVIGFVLGVLFTFETASRTFGRKTGLFAGLALAAMLGAAVEARIAKTDAALLAATAGALWALFTLYRHGTARAPTHVTAEPPSPWAVYGFWVALAAGTLIKGPILPGIVVLTLLGLIAMDRSFSWWRTLQPARGAALFAVLVLPWAIAIAVQTNWQFYIEALGIDFGRKLIASQESHGGPPGYHLALSPLTLWPSIIAVPAAAVALWRNRKEGWARFLAAWIVPFWLACELTPTKLPHYVLPTFPAIAIAIAAALRGPIGSYAKHIGAGLFILGGVVLFFAPPIASLIYGGLGAVLASLLVAGLVLGTAYLVVPAWLKGRPLLSLGTAAGGAAAIYAFALGLAGPQLSDFWVSERATQLIERTEERAPEATDLTPVVLAGYHEPSLIFMLGRETRLAANGAEAAAILSSEGARSALVDEPMLPAFEASLQERSYRVVAWGGVQGFNYSRGDDVDLSLLTIEAMSTSDQVGESDEP